MTVFLVGEVLSVDDCVFSGGGGGGGSIEC